DQDIDVTVVIEVPERAAPAGERRFHAGTGLPDQFFESAVAEIPEDHPWSLVGHCGKLLFDLRLDFTGDPEDIRGTAVIKMGNADAQTDEPRLDTEAAPYGHVSKIALAGVGVDRGSIIPEMRLDDVEMAVQVKIAGGDSHARLFHAVV